MTASIISPSLGAVVAMTVTNLSATLTNNSAWESARVDAQGASPMPMDYEVNVTIALTGAPAGPALVTVYCVPWFYDGSTWFAGGDVGTGTTEPSGTEGTATLGTQVNMQVALSLNYVTNGQTLRGQFNVNDVLSSIMCDGWSLVVLNQSGQTFGTTTIKYKPQNLQAS